MRDLNEMEIQQVTGAGATHCPTYDTHKKPKGNNGFGNGGGDPAPGNSAKTGLDKARDIYR